MTEQIPEVAPESPADEQPQADAAKTFDADYVERLRKEAAKYRTEAKSNADAAKRLAEFEESQKSEAQKVLDRAAAAERERDEARAEGLRYRAAAEHGISKDYFDLLGSGDEETISSRAERVGTLLKEHAEMKAELEALRAGKPAPTSQRPTAALKPGATAENHQTEDDANYARLFGADAR